MEITVKHWTRVKIASLAIVMDMEMCAMKSLVKIVDVKITRYQMLSIVEGGITNLLRREIDHKYPQTFSLHLLIHQKASANDSSAVNAKNIMSVPQQIIISVIAK